jgi:NTP pyrophosphatase (non-canonical NTP hydrolase)
MNFNQYQQEAKKYAIYKDVVIYPALGLASEAGEVCGKIKKILRDKNGVYNTEEKDVVAAEIGDVLWYLSALASDLHLDLNSIAQSNLDKLADRQSRNKISGSGDNR